MPHNKHNGDSFADKFNALVIDVEKRIEQDDVPIDLRLSMRRFWSVIKSCWEQLIAKPNNERNPIVMMLCREAVNSGVTLFLVTIESDVEKDQVDRAVMFLDHLARMFEDFSVVEKQANALMQQAARNIHQRDPTAPCVQIGNVIGFPVCPN